MHIPPLLQLTHDCEKLMDTICQMISEARKKNGDEYPDSTLSDIIVMLNVYMKKNEVDVNLLSDTFRHVCTVLDMIMKSRNAQGVGIPQPKDAISVAERIYCGKKESLASKILTPCAILYSLWSGFILDYMVVRNIGT